MPRVKRDDLVKRSYTISQATSDLIDRISAHYEMEKSGVVEASVRLISRAMESVTPAQAEATLRPRHKPAKKSEPTP